MKKVISILVLICIAFSFSACTKTEKDLISFTNDSGFELKIGMKKSDVEKAFNNSFENGKYYFVEDQNCCLVFIDNSLVYAEYGSGWKISKGPQMADEMTSLLDYFGDTESKAYILEPTDNPDVFNETYITLDYVFSDVRYSYNAGEDHVHISLVTSLDTKLDAEVIEKIKNDYYSDMYNEYAKTVPVIAAYGISNQIWSAYV